MKICYGAPRPFWIDNSLFVNCDGGYANPSGHSYVSTAAYLTLAAILTQFDFFRKRIYMQILLYILFLGLIIAILLSRLYLGVHTINQILYGGLLGFALYFLFVHIIRMHKMTSDMFFIIFTDKTIIIILASIQAIILAVSLLVYFLVQNRTNIYDISLKKLCPEIPYYRKFNNDGLVGCLSFITLIGSYYGLIFLAFISKRTNSNNLDAVMNWNQARWLHKLLIFLLFFVFVFLLFWYC